MWVFRLTSVELAVLIFAVVLGATALGVFLGRRVRHLSDDLKEPFGVLQGALLGVVGLILAFGLSLAVTRYEDRRASVVEEAAADREELLQRRLWALAGQAIDTEPVASAPRLYIETLNEMIDAQGVRVAALSNQVPIADLDRPTRGMIRVPDTALRNQLASMQLPPAAQPPSRP
jgi:hypothetical protein